MNQVRVWDWPTRLFHWSLALLFVALVVSAQIGGNAMVWHFRAGYAVCSLLMFRLIWGFVGGHWSRWRQLSGSPRSIQNYLRTGKNPAQSTYVGHNPLGSLSVIALLSFLSLQVATGLFSDDEISNAGPLTVFASEITIQWATFSQTEVGKVILLCLVGLHVLSIAWYFFKRHENLVKAMLSGNKNTAALETPSQDGLKDWLKAALVLSLSTALVYALISLGI